MARKNRTPEEKARREKIRDLLQMSNVGSMEDIQNLNVQRRKHGGYSKSVQGNHSRVHGKRT